MKKLKVNNVKIAGSFRNLLPPVFCPLCHLLTLQSRWLT